MRLSAKGALRSQSDSEMSRQARGLAFRILRWRFASMGILQQEPHGLALRSLGPLDHSHFLAGNPPLNWPQRLGWDRILPWASRRAVLRTALTRDRGVVIIRHENYVTPRFRWRLSARKQRASRSPLRPGQ